MEQAMGVEPTSKAWEAFILPMNYARILNKTIIHGLPRGINSDLRRILSPVQKRACRRARGQKMCKSTENAATSARFYVTIAEERI